MSYSPESISAAARQYVERGYPIVLLHGVTSDACTCARGSRCPSPGKHPVERDWANRGIGSVEELLSRWQARNEKPTNIGVLLDESWRPLLIDVDVKDGKGGDETLREWQEYLGIDLDEFLVQRTPSGGAHYLFRVPTGYALDRLPNAAGVANGIDVFRHGRQFVVSPSQTPLGRYGLNGNGGSVLPPVGELPVAPDVLLDHLSQLRPGGRTNGTPAKKQDLESLRAPSVELVRQAVECIPNEDFFSQREAWIGMAYRIRTACGTGNEAEAQEIFLDFSARWTEGADDPSEAERVFSTLREDAQSGGWPVLLDMAQRHGFDAPQWVVAAAATARVQSMFEFEELPPSEPDSVGSASRRSPIRSFTDVETVPIEWLLRGRLARREITMVNGWPGEGKTTVVIDIVAKLTRGLPLEDGIAPPCPLNVLLLSTEDNPSVLKLRLKAAGADLSRVLTIEDDEELDRLRLPSGRDRWIEFVRGEDIDVLVVDPMMAFLDGDLKNIAEQDARRFMQALRGILLETNSAAICIRHPNKASAGGNMNAVSASSGSLAFTAASRIEMLVGRTPNGDEVRALVSVKNNLAPAPKTLLYQIVSAVVQFCSAGENDEHFTQDVAAVKWIGVDETVSAEDLLSRRESREARSRLDEAKTFLKHYLADGPAPRKDVLTAARRQGIEKRTLERARGELGWTLIHGNLRYGGCQVWGLSDQTLDEYSQSHGGSSGDSGEAEGEEEEEPEFPASWTAEDEGALQSLLDEDR